MGGAGSSSSPVLPTAMTGLHPDDDRNRLVHQVLNAAQLLLCLLLALAPVLQGALHHLLLDHPLLARGAAQRAVL